MRHLFATGVAVAALVLAGSLGLSTRADEPHAGSKYGAYLGRDQLQVIKAFGPPSAVRSVRLVSTDPAQPVETGLVLTYKRPNDIRVECLVGADGRVLQVTERARALGARRVVEE
jgi:hypothetical protein